MTVIQPMIVSIRLIALATKPVPVALQHELRQGDADDRDDGGDRDPPAGDVEREDPVLLLAADDLLATGDQLVGVRLCLWLHSPRCRRRAPAGPPTTLPRMLARPRALCTVL